MSNRKSLCENLFLEFPGDRNKQSLNCEQLWIFCAIVIVFRLLFQKVLPTVHNEQRPEGETQLLSVALCLWFLREMPNAEHLFCDALLAQAVWTKGVTAQVL